jgi:hypothetical protein
MRLHPLLRLTLIAGDLSVRVGAASDFQAPEGVPLGVELLANGGLEAGSPAEPPADSQAWPPGYQFFPRRNGGTVVLDREVSIEGRSSMRLDPLLLGDSGFLCSHRAAIPARAGDVFHASIHVRVEGGFECYRSLTIEFQAQSADGSKLERVSVLPPRILPGRGDWRKIELTAAAPPNTRQVSAVAFKVSNTTMFGRCWWDALSLTKLKAQEPDLRPARSAPEFK